MNIYCEKELFDKLQEEPRHIELQQERITAAPVFSMRKMYGDYDRLCNSWQFGIKEVVPGEKRAKALLRKTVFKFVPRMFKEAINRQTSFNLSVLHIMEDVLQEMDYLSSNAVNSGKKPFTVICCDPIAQESNLQEMLAAFQYYSRVYNSNSVLLFLNNTIEEPDYYVFLQRTIYEFQMRNVKIVITDNYAVKMDYCSKAALQMSFNKKNKDHMKNITLLQYDPERKDYMKNEIVIDSMELKETADIIRCLEE